MEQILNAKERSGVFVRFLILFLITVALVTGAAYFNYAMPGKVNNVLREEITMQQSEEQYQQKFIDRAEEAKALLDSINKGNANVNLLDMQLTERITELLNLQSKDSSVYSRMDKVITETFLQLQQAKKALSTAGDNIEKLSALEAELAKYKADLSTVQGQLDNFRKATAQ